MRRGIHIQISISDELTDRIEDWRQKQSIPPSRTATILYMLEKGLDLLQPNPKKVKT